MKIRTGFVSNSSSCSYALIGHLGFEMDTIVTKDSLEKTINVHHIIEELQNKDSLYSYQIMNYKKIKNNTLINNTYRNNMLITIQEIIKPNSLILVCDNKTNYEDDNMVDLDNCAVIIFTPDKNKNSTTVTMIVQNCDENQSSYKNILQQLNKYFIILLYIDKNINVKTKLKASPVLRGDGWGGDPMGPGEEYNGDPNKIQEAFDKEIPVLIDNKMLYASF